jgi:hypothetical protein
MLSLQSSEMERYWRDSGIAEASVPLNQPRAANERSKLRANSRPLASIRGRLCGPSWV